MSICDHTMRGGTCQLDLDHSGRHTTQAFDCDACGNTRRGNVHGHLHNQYDYDHEVVESFAICFFCQRATQRANRRGE